jgi:hypothetical protein
MAHAFMRALLRWAVRRRDPSTIIAIPTGSVDAAELGYVVCALKRCTP